MNFWEDSDRAIDSVEIPSSLLDFMHDCLRLRQVAKDLDSYVCRLGNFSMEVRLQTSSVGIGEDRSPLNANAKVFQKPTEYVKKQGAEVRRIVLEKVDWKIRLGKARRGYIMSSSESYLGCGRR